MKGGIGTIKGRKEGRIREDGRWRKERRGGKEGRKDGRKDDSEG